MKKRLIITAGLVLLALLIFLVRSRFQKPSYEIVKPKFSSITEAVYGLGKVKTDQRFDVKIGVLSTVRGLYVREGDTVEKGEKLVEFDAGALFRAPFAGTVTKVSTYAGETALPQATILRLENLKARYIEISLEQQAALRVTKGQTARVSLESLRGQVLKGTVVALYPREDEFLAHVVVKDLSLSVLPGMTADVSIEIGKIEKALLVPLKAVANGMVLVRRHGREEKVKVEIGHVDGLSAEIRGGGITPEDEILVPTKVL